jgi:hypothetical protein
MRGVAASLPQIRFTNRREVGDPGRPPCGDRRPKANKAADREPGGAGARLSQKGRRSRREWARRVRSSPGRAVAGADAPAVAPAAGCLAGEVNWLDEEPVLNTGGESLA